MPYVLIASDDPEEGRRLHQALAADGYKVLAPLPGKSAMKALQIEPDLMIIDPGTRGDRGLDLLRRLRQENTTIPIVILCPDGTEAKIVDALDWGADIVVTKPYSMPELLARMRRRVRRMAASTSEPSHIVVGDLYLDLLRKTTLLAGKSIGLTSKEFDLLALMARHAGRVLTQSFLLSRLWTPTTDSQQLRAYIRQLRCKIEPNPDQPVYIMTNFGVGYTLLQPGSEDAS